MSGVLEKDDIERLVMKPTGRRRLGKYVLLGRVGHGGMGKIYLAYAPGPAGIEKLLVVKRLHSHLTGDAMLVSSFLDEARLSMALSHPNIVTTFDVGEVDGRFFMVMEFIDGQNLGVLLRTAKRSNQYPSSHLWAGMFSGVLDGLHAAHHAKDARGRPLQIIHRDVSPQNVLITYEGIPKLVDFGIAKAAMRVSETDAGVLKGKYAYMSPEQVRGEPLDARSDVFAAGVVLWEMLAGRRLYKADSIVRSVERILTEAPISPVRVNAECDPDIAKVAFKALQKDRAHRFDSAEAMKDALDEAAHKKGGPRFRQSDVRDLMQRLFHDVIERQRAVLEVALTSNESAAVDDDALDDASKVSAHDSASDLSIARVPARDASENTTPSIVRPSPLVTADNEHKVPAPEPQHASTSLERKRPATVVPPPIRAFDGVEVTETQTNPPESSRARVFVAAAVVVVVGVLLGAVAVKLRLFHAAAPAVPIVLAPVDAGVAPVALAAADAGVAVVDAGVVAVVAVVDAGSAPIDTREPEVAPAGKRHRTREKPEKIAEVVEKPADAPIVVEEPADKSADKATGFLSLDTVPWTVVYLGKKKLGETPLVNVVVPAGTLELLLVNSDAGIKEQYIAKVKPGETFRQRLDLQ